MARDQIAMTPLTSRDELVAWLAAGVKPKSEFRIGTEHAKTPFTLEGHNPVPYEGARGIGALLEGMQESSVTVGGASRPLPAPFFVLATQNPIEMEGTYPLPEAQLDRFLLKLRVRYPAIEELNAIIDRTTHAGRATGSAGFLDKLHLHTARAAEGRHQRVLYEGRGGRIREAARGGGRGANRTWHDRRRAL